MLRPTQGRRFRATAAVAMLLTASLALALTRGEARATQRASRSTSLLPILVREAPPVLAPELTERLEPCEPASPGGCYRVPIKADRRPAVILPPGADLAVEITADAGDELRFAISRPKMRGRLLKLTTKLEHPELESETKVATPRGGWAWREVRVPIKRSGQQKLSFSVSTPPRENPYTGIAIAAPRIISRSSAEGRDRPNILLYLIDTLRADHTSPHGYARDTTPHLGRLADRGIVFENTTSTAPRTRPATASLLTSLFPSEHEARNRRGLGPEVQTLAETLRPAGWSTWAFVANGNVFDAAFRFDQGFDAFHTIRGKNLDNHAHTEEINALVLAGLQEFADEPFFLFVHAVDPHSPYDPPQDYRGTYTSKSYEGEITPATTLHSLLKKREITTEDAEFVEGLYDEDIRYQDEMFGVLLDRLSHQGILDETLVVVVADHGDEFLEHGGWEHGRKLWEHQTHVPFVVSGPGISPSRIDEPVSLVDVMPTLLAYLDVPSPSMMRGQDLSSTLRGKGIPEPRPIYSEEVRGDFEWNALRKGSWKIIRKAPWQGTSSWESGATYRLYDLATDPGEQQDLAKKNPERIAAMKQELTTMRQKLQPIATTTTEQPMVEVDPRTQRQLKALGYLDE